jgi:hypothetical protein
VSFRNSLLDADDQIVPDAERDTFFGSCGSASPTGRRPRHGALELRLSRPAERHGWSAR